MKKASIRFSIFFVFFVSRGTFLMFYCLFTGFVAMLYPHNPKAVHNKLDELLDSLQQEDWKSEQYGHIISLLYTVSQKHPEVVV